MLNRREIFFILLPCVSAAAYLGFSYWRGALGFPLDDAWIHQAYARNIGTRGEFAFFAGQPSAGSTSPLWTILLGIGYFLRVDFRVWAYLLGALLLGASVVILGRLAARISPIPRLPVYCFLFTVFEWHLAWSAVSGMEIPLFVFLSLLLLERFYARERSWVLGLIAGLLTLTRPEGAVLGALMGLGLIASVVGAKQSPLNPTLLREVEGIVLYTAGFAILIAPYLAFNLAVSGAIFPNTFYAKNAEYAVLIESTPFLIRFAQTVAAPWVGAQILLLPGFIFTIARLVKDRDWGALVPFAWIVALPALYALRLPVTYQHGRYEMPLVPFIALYGIWGTMELSAMVKNFVVRATWGTSTAAVLIVFWFFGANAYAGNVAFVDCEMVQTAHWVAQNAPSDALIAAHDIGALGYVYPRPFIDLAGLVSPEVIPFISDDKRLREYLVARKVEYAIFMPDFSDWYHRIAQDAHFVTVFETNCAVTRAEGGTHMRVYQIR